MLCFSRQSCWFAGSDTLTLSKPPHKNVPFRQLPSRLAYLGTAFSGILTESAVMMPDAGAGRNRVACVRAVLFHAWVDLATLRMVLFINHQHVAGGGRDLDCFADVVPAPLSIGEISRWA